MVAALLDYEAATECEFNCETEKCESGHKLIESQYGNDDDFEDMGAHSECYAYVRCVIHTCGVGEQTSLALTDLEAVRELLPTIPIERILALQSAESNLILHRERQTVQILGCGGLVLANVELTGNQKSTLEELSLDEPADVE